MSKIAVESMPTNRDIIWLRFAVYGNFKFTRTKIGHFASSIRWQNDQKVSLPLESSHFSNIRFYQVVFCCINQVYCSCGVHAYKSEHYFTSLKYLFGNFKFPPRNWTFCLTHPLAKSPKLVIRASFRKLLISPITNVFIKPFSAQNTAKIVLESIHTNQDMVCLC